MMSQIFKSNCEDFEKLVEAFNTEIRKYKSEIDETNLANLIYFRNKFGEYRNSFSDFSRFFLKYKIDNPENNKVASLYFDAAEFNNKECLEVYILDLNDKISNLHSKNSKKRDYGLFWGGVIIGVVFSILGQVFYDKIIKEFITKDEINQRYINEKFDKLDSEHRALFDTLIKRNDKSVELFEKSIPKIRDIRKKNLKK